MKAGISTACFYPQKVIDSLIYFAENEIDCAEIFFNTFYETEKGYVAQLKNICNVNSIEIKAIHPFLSPIEPMMFFSDFEGRFEDGLALYKPFFEAGQTLGAKYFILHGDYLGSPRSVEQYCERYEKLNRFAANYGIDVLQENVVRNSSATAANIVEMRKTLGGNIGFALDLKQVIRAKQNLSEMIGAMGSSLRHIHISDNLPGQDCVLPGLGVFDFSGFIETLRQKNYDGSLMLELYRGSYDNPKELIQSYRLIKDKLNHV